MSARGRPAAINYVDSPSVKKYLQEYLKELTTEQIDIVANTVGGHLGDVGRVVAEMHSGIPPDTSTSTYLKGKVNLPLVDLFQYFVLVILHRIISKDIERMSEVATGSVIGLRGITANGVLGADVHTNILIGINGSKNCK
jgi:hypothetical protein